jgi:hypothetical protein
MVYELRYHLMCTVDGSIDENLQRTHTVHAKNDVVAIVDANEFLKAEKSGLVIPWAPMLYEGERLIAKSDPGYPPNAHYLSWVGETREPQNSFQDLINQVCQELQDDFILFVDRGEANPGYLKHLDYCPKCKKAIDEAFERQSKALESIARLINCKSQAR